MNDNHMKSEPEQSVSLPPVDCDTAPLNWRELTSLRALIAYTACEQKLHEAVVEEAVTGQFGVKAITELQGRSYEAVIIFLVDLQADLLLN